MTESLAEQIDALLPQTQCTQCSFADCKAYAQAISEGRADINQCPPGGAAGIRKLALLLRVEEKPLDSKFGREQSRKVAFIVEQDCIGCTKCIPACPLDAILGTHKQMHTVISNECSGCELCVAPCPVDCIIMQQADPLHHWDQSAANLARQRYQNKQQRLQQQAQIKAERFQKQKLMLSGIKR